MSELFHQGKNGSEYADKECADKEFFTYPRIFIYIYFFFAGELLNNSSKNYYKVLVA